MSKISICNWTPSKEPDATRSLWIRACLPSPTSERALRRPSKPSKRGDQLVIWKMDRAFRSLRHAMDVFDHFEVRDIEFCDLTEGIDTSTPMGKCFFQVRNAFSELERNLISERTMAGMAAAKRRGVHCGRPAKLNRSQILNAKKRISAGAEVKALAAKLSVHEATLHRALKGKSALPN